MFKQTNNNYLSEMQYLTGGQTSFLSGVSELHDDVCLARFPTKEAAVQREWARW